MASKRRLRSAASYIRLIVGLPGMTVAQTTSSPVPAATETVPETTAPSDEQRDIIVTATGRRAQAFDVPLALSVTSGRDLARANVTSIANISAIDPAVTVRNYGPGVSSFLIRGISSQAQPTVGVYYDNAPLLGGYQTESAGDPTPTLRLIDIDRIEVLKGPQGTLFGAGSMAGTVRAITVKPRLDAFGGEVAVQGGATSHGNPAYQGSLTLNVPLSSTLGVRAVGWTEQGGGYVDRQSIYGGPRFKNSNDLRLWGTRATALWRPGDAFELVAKYTLQAQHASDGNLTYAGYGRYQSGVPSVGPYSDGLSIYDATGVYVGLGGEISATVAHTDYDRTRRNDGTSSNILFLGRDDPTNFAEKVRYHGTTAELRYTSKWDGPFQLVAGAYYQHDATRILGSVMVADRFSGGLPCTDYFQCLDQGRVGGTDFALPGNVQYSVLGHHDRSQQAYYAQGEYKFLSHFTATVGARYFRARLHDDTQSLYSIGQYLGLAPLGVGPVQVLVPSTQSKPSYNVSLAWSPSATLNTYVRVASGFRIGGLNDSLGAASNFGINIPSSYAPDSLWNYEWGVKLSLLDRRILFDGTIFHIDWSGQQLPGADPTQVVAYTINAGKTRVNGTELNIRTLPFDGFSLDAGITYVSAKLAQDLPVTVLTAGTIGYKGDYVPNNPRWSGTIQSEYHAPVFGGWDGYLRGSLTYKGRSKNRFSGDPEGVVIPGATVVGLRVGVRSAETDISLIADNLLNEYVINGIQKNAKASGLPDQPFVSPPRTVSIRVTRKF